MRCDEQGALSVPLMFALLAIALLGMGTWGVMRHWRSLMETQLRIDRCVGEAAIDLARALGRIEKANTTLRAMRAAEIPLTLVGQAPATRAAIQAVARYQDLERLNWRRRQAQWMAMHGCGIWNWDRARPLPGMAWRRPPDDMLGPKPLEWEPQADRILWIQLSHRPRQAAARVEQQGTRAIGLGDFLGGGKWQAKWAIPR